MTKVIVQHRSNTLPAPAVVKTRRLLHVGWFAAAAAIAFAIPNVFSTRLGLSNDLYYLIYFAFVGALLAGYVTVLGVDLGTLLRRSWGASLLLGVPIAGLVVAFVWSRPATPVPTGPYLAFEVLWRGVAYGMVDALLLTAFPGMVAFGVLGENLRGVRNRVAYIGLALFLSIVMTTTYHLGYAQFREQGVQQPVTGNVMISIPMLATANPAGSFLAHAAMHVAAVTHSYETELFLPPQTMVAPRE
jgi:hypothetical protein